MNLLGLTADEVLRVCVPETELEKRLYEIATDRIDSDKEELERLTAVNEDLDAEIQQASEDLTDCQGIIHDAKRDIRSAIDLLDEKDIEAAIKLLEGIL